MLELLENVRYCNVCLDYRPTSQFSSYRTELDGGINICYRHAYENPLETVPEKYCKKCDVFLSVVNFQRKARRKYLCDKHTSEIEKICHQKQREKPWKKELARLVSLCQSDCRNIFKQPKIQMTQSDVARLFVGSYFTDGPGQSVEGKFDLAVLPKDPCKVLCSDNAILVTRRSRLRMLDCMKHAEWDTYKTLLEKMQLK